MTPHLLTDLRVLDQYLTQQLPPGYSTTQRTFYSPVDDVHGALRHSIASTSRSLILAMYGFDDEELADIIRHKLEDPDIYVQLTLDSSQAGGKHEKALLEREHYPASIVAVGRSERGAIMHLKEGVIDGAVVFTGSTNWSDGGETKQDNQLDIEINPLKAATAAARIGAIHANILNKAAKR